MTLRTFLGALVLGGSVAGLVVSARFADTTPGAAQPESSASEQARPAALPASASEQPAGSLARLPSARSRFPRTSRPRRSGGCRTIRFFRYFFGQEQPVAERRLRRRRVVRWLCPDQHARHRVRRCRHPGHPSRRTGAAEASSSASMTSATWRWSRSTRRISRRCRGATRANFESPSGCWRSAIPFS